MIEVASFAGYPGKESHGVGVADIHARSQLQFGDGLVEPFLCSGYASEFDVVAQVGVVLGRHVLEHGLPPETMLNVNVPQLPIQELNGIAITRQGLRNYGDDIHKREDPRGKPYYWIGGFRPEHIIHDGTDFEAIAENKVSVTPLHRDITHYKSLELLKERDIQL